MARDLTPDRRNGESRPPSHFWPFRLSTYTPATIVTLSLPESRSDPTLIRFDPNSSKLSVASAEMIVIYLTSQDILDYDLLSDFFLTFRMFVTPHQLLELLIGRMAWAVLTQSSATERSEVGRDVAVRTFVMLRHWILNFFADDFVPSYNLRVSFSNHVTALYSWELGQTSSSFIHILNQLKTCWLRSCALYWDLPSPDLPTKHPSIDPQARLPPGGKIGSTGHAGIAATRRTTVLSMYKMPIRPVLSTSEIPEPSQQDPLKTQDHVLSMMGSLIKGGISLSIDVEVRAIHPPTPVQSMAPILDIEKKPQRTARSMVDFWKREFRLRKDKAMNRFFSRIMHIDSSHNKPPSEATRSLSESEQGKVRVDILSARVIEELDNILKCQDFYSAKPPDQATPVTSQPISHSNLRESSISSRSDLSDKSSRRSHQSISSTLSRSPATQFQSPNPDSITNDTSFGSSTNTPEVENKNLDPSSEPPSPHGSLTFDTSSKSSPISPIINFSHSSLSPVRNLRPFSQTSYRPSLIDSMSIRNSIALHVCPPPQIGQVDPSSTASGLEWDSNSEISVPNPNTLSIQSIRSFDSYDSQLSDQVFTSGDAAPVGLGLRRMKNLNVLRGQSPSFCNSSTPSFFSSDMRGAVAVSITEPRISVLKPRPMNMRVSNYHAGERPSVAMEGTDTSALQGYRNISDLVAELALIPDDTPEDDEIDAALRKLEGTYVKHEKKFSMPHRGKSLSSSPPLSSTSLYEKAFDTPTKAKDGQNAGRKRPPSLKLKTDRGQDPITAAGIPRAPQDPLSVASSLLYGNHVPFVLNFSSKQLAEQFTLIERDALSEIDWKELIELKWNQKLDPVQSWLGYLVEGSATGVEVVISRFNLMVNWIKSEILLTRVLSERVQAIARFIHVAHQARRLQNYATMMQVVLALSSGCIRRLRKTWKAVLPEDTAMLETLENVVSPFRNFHRLRAEFNSVDTSKGCIPFLAVYLSDLTYNAERPAMVEANNGPLQTSSTQNNLSEDPISRPKKLVNFDRFRMSASIVKSLIQCIEWSGNYKINGDSDLLAKCLYIQCLTNEEMESCIQYLDET